jgi:hypothetical protein
MSAALVDELRAALGFVPGAVGVMGKWEPFSAPARCLREVAARAAAAVAISEALERGAHGAPYLLSAEGQLRGQIRPGCQLCAEILVDLGADPSRIRCCAGSNRTAVELRVLDRMRRELAMIERSTSETAGLLLITSGYHAPRTRLLLQRARPPLEAVALLELDSALVRRALAELPESRRARLSTTIAAARNEGLSRASVALTEALGELAMLLPSVEGIVADVLRGAVDPRSAMFQPRL